MEMQYRNLGRSGLKLSVLSFGSWVTFGPQLDRDLAAECLRIAYDAGVNFFDNAEVYAGGESERIMGDALRDLGWPRSSYVVSSKFFWGIQGGVNTRNTLNRKYLLQAIDGSLERFGLDFLDLVFCHRPDPETPVEETVWAMHDIIDRGKAHYWGTSEWPAETVRAAHRFATDNHLHAPLMEQPQYNLLARQRVEQEYAPLYDEIGLGLTVWSPLASGLLTGKYLEGVPQDSRLNVPGYAWLRDVLLTEDNLAKVRRLKHIADRLGVSLTHLSLAWCALNPRVTTVITGASRPDHVRDNMEALDVVPMLTEGILQEIDAALA
jgi:voltage-dependent potassium channel beta subunit